MKTCNECGGEIKDNRKKKYCSRKCMWRNRSKNYYYKYHKKQQQRVLNNYHKYGSTKKGKEKIRKINVKAKARQRFGINNRLLILGKFNFQCVFCLFKGNKTSLAIHHLDGRGRNTKKPNNNTNNLVSVCRSCHSKIHFHNKKLKQLI